MCYKKDSPHWHICITPKKGTLSHSNEAGPVIHDIGTGTLVVIDSWLDAHWFELRMHHGPNPESSILPLTSSYPTIKHSLPRVSVRLPAGLDRTLSAEVDPGLPELPICTFTSRAHGATGMSVGVSH